MNEANTVRQTWKGSDLCLLGDSRIRNAGSDYSAFTTHDEMVVLKPREYFERYGSLGLEDVRRIVEVGIFQGGSLVLLADLFPDAEILGIDIKDCNLAVLSHIDRLGFRNRIKLAHGVSQDDRERLGWLVETLWGSDELDLVIDDASHLYSPSIATFDLLFPKLRTGGLYVIEDWGWAHWNDYSGNLLELSATDRALSSMILELVVAAAAYPEAVAEVIIDKDMAIIRKGPEAPPSFGDLVRLNGNRTWNGL
jgi:hypothetical protein